MKPTKAILIGSNVFIVIYLAFCFGEADFNISHWDCTTRYFCGFIGVVLGALLMCAYAQYKTTK